MTFWHDIKSSPPVLATVSTISVLYDFARRTEQRRLTQAVLRTFGRLPGGICAGSSNNLVIAILANLVVKAYGAYATAYADICRKIAGIIATHNASIRRITNWHIQ